MKKFFFLMFLISLFFTPAFESHAQSLSSTNSTTATFDMTGMPQWAKDIRRFDIIAFGSFPFSIFFVSTVMDLIRWNDANGFDMSEEGRRYAPWPAKSAGAIEMTNNEYTQMFLYAAGVSMVIALADFIIVHIKRSKERRRLESLPTGSYEIEREPYGEQDEGTLKETEAEGQ